jgi:hypothetical protein
MHVRINIVIEPHGIEVDGVIIRNRRSAIRLAEWIKQQADELWPVEQPVKCKQAKP